MVDLTDLSAHVAQEIPVDGIAVVGGNQPARPRPQSDDTPLDEALTPAEWMITINEIAKLPPGKQWSNRRGLRTSGARAR